MTRLMFKRLWHYDYSPAQHVYEVKKGDVVLGLVENWEGRGEWKAFSSSGFSCKYLSEHYSRRRAVEAIVEAAANYSL